MSKVSLTRNLLDAYYSFAADNNLRRLDFIINVGYINDPALRDLLEKNPVFSNGFIKLNLSVQATRNINYVGDNFYAMLKFSGVPVSLTIPFHAFYGIELPVGESDVMLLEFPKFDEYQFITTNPNYVYPYGFDESSMERKDSHVVDDEHNLLDGDIFKLIKSSKEAPRLELVSNEKLVLNPQPPSRYKGKPKLTLIHGGKK